MTRLVQIELQTKLRFAKASNNDDEINTIHEKLILAEENTKQATLAVHDAQDKHQQLSQAATEREKKKHAKKKLSAFKKRTHIYACNSSDEDEYNALDESDNSDHERHPERNLVNLGGSDSDSGHARQSDDDSDIHSGDLMNLGGSSSEDSDNGNPDITKRKQQITTNRKRTHTDTTRQRDRSHAETGRKQQKKQKITPDDANTSLVHNALFLLFHAPVLLSAMKGALTPGEVASSSHSISSSSSSSPESHTSSSSNSHSSSSSSSQSSPSSAHPTSILPPGPVVYVNQDRSGHCGPHSLLIAKHQWQTRSRYTKGPLRGWPTENKLRQQEQRAVRNLRIQVKNQIQLIQISIGGMDQTDILNMDKCGPYEPGSSSFRNQMDNNIAPVWFLHLHMSIAANILQLRVVILFGSDPEVTEFVREANHEAELHWPLIWVHAKTQTREWQAMPNEQIATVGTSRHWNLLRLQ
jgi:hypothetical protein